MKILVSQAVKRKCNDLNIYVPRAGIHNCPLTASFFNIRFLICANANIMCKTNLKCSNCLLVDYVFFN